jgi:hypothetical protein
MNFSSQRSFFHRWQELVQEAREVFHGWHWGWKISWKPNSMDLLKHYVYIYIL